MEQIQYGVAAVPHQYQGTVGQPAAQLQDHLAGPVGELLVRTALSLIIAFRGCQHRQERQGPVAAGQGICPSHIREIQRRPLALTI